jgi:crossover junction endodeoxyribonuclease RuvC
MRILGIDPGSRATGYGVIESRGGRLDHVAHGIIRPSAKLSLARRLECIHRGVLEAAEQHRPDIAAVELVFTAVNPRSALILGQARGAALTALGAMGLDVFELAAREVKQAVVGTGGAEKAQVQAMVMRLLSLDSAPPSDAADALAVAISQANAGRLKDLGVRTRASRRRGMRGATHLLEDRR